MAHLIKERAAQTADICAYSAAVLRPRADGPELPKPDSRLIRPIEGTDMTTTGEPYTATTTAPMSAICEALGVPPQDWHVFARWADRPLTPKARDELFTYVDVMIADRCRRPGDDLLSALIELEVDGEELTTDDLRTFIAALVDGQPHR
jgi:cytochrome P450